MKSRLPLEKGGWIFLWEGDALALGRYLFDSWLYRFRLQDFPLIHFDIDGAVRLHETPALAWALTVILRYVLEKFPADGGPWDKTEAVALLEEWTEPDFFVREARAPEEQLSYFKERLRESPDCRGLWLGYASACEAAGAYGEAEKAYDRALEMETDGETLMERARARLAGGRTEEALSDMMKALTGENSDWLRLWPEAAKLLAAKKSPWLALEASLKEWKIELEGKEFARLLEIFLRLSLSLTRLAKENPLIGGESAELKAALGTLLAFESSLA
ncbi:MAG: hypothetical protein HYT78_14375 [Deltaproteobacteria bacterium]|nr:hypothetical protein [Deltaproteobacteria bacterium]